MAKTKIKSLKPNDIIDIIAPGFTPNSASVKNALELLRSWGFRPRMPQDLLVEHFLHANTDEKRFLHFKNAILAKDSRFIWCLRGGYGSNRLWPYLLKMKKPTQKKIIIGLSDCTSLQHFASQFWKWPCIHGAHLDRLGQEDRNEQTTNELKDLLEGKTRVTDFKNLKPLNDRARKIKKINSQVIGGNLVTLQSSIGTKTEIKLDKKILFLEEIGERAYRIDRVLVHFKQSGLLDKAAAIVFGEFYKCEEKDGKKLYLDVIDRFASEVKIPLFFGVETGHGEIQRPLFMSTPATLYGGALGHLHVESGVEK